MKLFLLAILMLAGGVTACSAFSKSDAVTSFEFFDIKGRDIEAVVKPELEINNLTLADIAILKWPLSIKPCESCLVKTGKRFHPDGPTTWIELKGVTSSSIFWVIETFQPRISIQGWMLEFKPKFIQFSKVSNNILKHVDYSKELPQPISKQPDCTLLWFKRAPLEQPPANIADDVADFKTQAIWKCQS